MFLLFDIKIAPTLLNKCFSIFFKFLRFFYIF
nr:MAG TPA: hypothetical protein [Caudoviricetes sp.]